MLAFWGVYLRRIPFFVGFPDFLQPQLEAAAWTLLQAQIFVTWAARFLGRMRSLETEWNGAPYNL